MGSMRATQGSLTGQEEGHFPWPIPGLREIDLDRQRNGVKIVVELEIEM